jgi:hypothetical protein
VAARRFVRRIWKEVQVRPRWKPLSVALGMAAIVALPALGGCAAGGTRLHAVEIVEWQQQERERLEAQGFPQATGE